MRAIVLVGGFGTRLRPLTLTTPKPMLPIGHRPMITRLIDRLARGGVTDVVLALGFRPEPFFEAFPGGRCGGVAVHYAVEPEPLDTAGAIRFAADTVGVNDTFVVANGDVMTDLDVADLVAFHRRMGAEATIHLTAVDDPSNFGVVDLDPDRSGPAGSGMVRSFVEKPAPGTEPSNLINAGTYVLEPSVLDLMPVGRASSIERDVFPIVVARHGVFGMPTDDYWIDAGRPELYLAANLDLLSGVRRHDHCEPIDPRSSVDPTATITNSIVGEGAVVGPDAVVTNSVLLPHCYVGPAARIESSLVMGRVNGGASIVRTMVGADGTIEPGAVLSDAAVPATN
jgi:mannose-1-phosphate guanylyltransferase